MAKSLHPKILELRNKRGSSPIHFSSSIKQPEATRATNSSSNSDDSDPRILKQYFCVWGEEDDFGMIPMKGCFKKSIEERGPNSQAAQKVTALFAHNQHKVLAVPTVLKEDEIGLYAEYRPDEGVQHCDEAVIQIRSGSINGGSYGFNFIWDKMEYDDKVDAVRMYDCILFEVSPVVFGAQSGTFAVRSAAGIFEDELLSEETEQILKHIPRSKQLEMRSIIDRHISLAKLQMPLELRQKAQSNNKPKQVSLISKVLKEMEMEFDFS